MAELEPAPHADPARLLAKDYWLVMSSPNPGVDKAAIQDWLSAHLDWMLSLERAGVLFASGPLLDGPGVGPGSGITVLRAADEQRARLIAAEDPFVLAGLRSFELYRWRINEGSVSVRLSLGTGTYDWD